MDTMGFIHWNFGISRGQTQIDGSSKNLRVRQMNSQTLVDASHLHQWTLPLQLSLYTLARLKHLWVCVMSWGRIFIDSFWDIHWQFEIFIVLWIWTQTVQKFAIIWTSKTRCACIHEATLQMVAIVLFLVCEHFVFNVASSWNSSFRFSILWTNVPRRLYPPKPPTSLVLPHEKLLSATITKLYGT